MTYFPQLNTMIDLAKQNLATKLGVSAGTIQVVSAIETNWSNGSMGCPKPGMVYTQSTIGGFHIILSYGKKQYDYRSHKTGEPTLCANPQ